MVLIFFLDENLTSFQQTFSRQAQVSKLPWVFWLNENVLKGQPYKCKKRGTGLVARFLRIIYAVFRFLSRNFTSPPRNANRY